MHRRVSLFHVEFFFNNNSSINQSWARDNFLASQQRQRVNVIEGHDKNTKCVKISVSQRI